MSRLFVFLAIRDQQLPTKRRHAEVSVPLIRLRIDAPRASGCACVLSIAMCRPITALLVRPAVACLSASHGAETKAQGVGCEISLPSRWSLGYGACDEAKGWTR